MEHGFARPLLERVRAKFAEQHHRIVIELPPADRIEIAVDKCEDVANVIESVVVKYA